MNTSELLAATSASTEDVLCIKGPSIRFPVSALTQPNWEEIRVRMLDDVSTAIALFLDEAVTAYRANH